MKRDSLVNTTLAGRYRIDALLGEGGMGRVYAGEHVLMRKRVAVKVLHRELTSVPEVVARFEREAMAAANIDHSNIAAATDFGKLEDGSVYLVLEYVEGQSLRDLVAQGPLPIERAIKIARQIASALAAAHALDIVHRDLKPENVMLVTRVGDPDFVKVLDFGIAKVPLGEPKLTEGGPITRAGMVFGTPEYMAPEQALGQPVDGRADLYSLGVIFFEMLAGRRPFSSATGVGILGQQLSRLPPTIAERAPGVSVPPAVEQVMHRLLARDLAERYQKAADAMVALDGLLGMAAAPGPRLFTRLSGSPTAVLGSAIAPPRPAPRRSSEAVTGPPQEVVRPGLGAGFGSYADGTLDQEQGSEPRALAAPPGLGMPGMDQATWPAPPPEPPVRADVPEAMLGFPAPPPLPAGLPPVALAPPSRFDRGWWQRRVESWLERLQPAWQKLRPAWQKLLPVWQKLLAGGARVRPHVTRAAKETGEALGLALAVSTAWVDRRRERLPGPLAKVPAAAFLGLAGLLVFTTVGALGVLLLRGASARAARSAAHASSAAASAAPSTSAATLDDEIARARGGGSAALEALLRQHPTAAAIQLELAKAYLLEKRHVDAVRAAQQALSRDPTFNQNTELARALWHAAQPVDSMEPTFTLLEGPMGSKGADIVYDLLVTPGVRKEVKQRGEAFVKSPRFAEQATPALKAAVALRAAPSCQKAYALLPEVASLGDERVLKQLKRYESAVGCGRYGRRDCYPCMRQDSRLKDAIRAIEARTKAGAMSSAAPRPPAR